MYLATCNLLDNRDRIGDKRTMPRQSTASADFERPILSVDIVLFTLCAGKLAVALTPRGVEPFRGETALPGGYVRVDEDPDAESTVRRVLRDKAGLEDIYVEQLRT